MTTGIENLVHGSGSNHPGYRHDISTVNILHLLSGGMTKVQVAAQLGVSSGFIHRRLRQAKEDGLSVPPTVRHSPWNRGCSNGKSNPAGMKICTICNTPKVLDEFVKDPTRLDGRDSRCLDCARKRQNARNRSDAGQVYLQASRGRRIKSSRVYYQGNSITLKAQVTDRRQAGKAFIDSLKSAPCVDCDRSFPSFCMDFDHVRGSKRTEVSRLKSSPKETVLEEVAKCDLVCHVCHRIRTASRLPPPKQDKKQVFNQKIHALKAAPCTDCCLPFPPVAMDFDHVRGEKLQPISEMCGASWDRVLEELAKTELVCANCHRIRTNQRATVRVLMPTES
jgi:hypothetical protein